MNIYDKTHEIARLIKESPEYISYKALKDRLYADERTKVLLIDYKKMQFEAQASYLSGNEPDPSLMDKLKKMGEVLQFNSEVTEYFAAEYRFNTLIGDIYKIIGDACDLDLDLLHE